MTVLDTLLEFDARELRDLRGRWSKGALLGFAGTPAHEPSVPDEIEKANEEAHKRRRKAGLPDARPSTLYPGLAQASVLSTLVDSPRLEG